jgi:hypothetical protein
MLGLGEIEFEVQEARRAEAGTKRIAHRRAIQVP